MKIRLSDEERERYGCPEWLDCSLSTLPVREAEALEEATGMEPLDAIRTMIPVRENHPTDAGKVRWRYTPRGVRLLVWLGLWRTGVTVPFAELDFDYSPYAGWQIADAEVSEGKDEGSPASGPTTPSISATSSRRTRSKTSPS